MRRALVGIAAALALLAGCTQASVSDDDNQASGPTDDGVLTADTVLQSCPEQDGDPIQAAEKLPPLTFDCIGGGTLDLSRAPGVPTVINIWGSWCPPCRGELPYVQQLADAAGDQVQVLGVVTSDTLSGADSFAADTGLTFPSGFDQEGDLLTELGYRGPPYTFFLAADGTLTYTEVGPVESLDEIEQLVAEHLGVSL